MLDTMDLRHSDRLEEGGYSSEEELVDAFTCAILSTMHKPLDQKQLDPRQKAIA